MYNCLEYDPYKRLVGLLLIINNRTMRMMKQLCRDVLILHNICSVGRSHRLTSKNQERITTKYKTSDKNIGRRCFIDSAVAA